MAITYVTNTSTSVGGTATTFTLTCPTTQAGDILLLDFAHNGTGDGTLSGTTITTGELTWTKKHAQLIYSNTRSGKTYWARATGDHSGQTVIVSSIGDYSTGLLTIYRGCLSSGDALAGATIVGELNASGNETQEEIVTTVDNCMVIFIVANGNGNYGITNPACTSPGALTRRVQGSGTVNCAHSSSDTLKVTAGGTGAFTWSQTNAITGSWAYALLPALAGPANLKSYNTNLKANIKTINTNPIANVKSLNTNV